MSDKKKEPDFDKLNQFLETLPASIQKAVGEGITGVIQQENARRAAAAEDDDEEDEDDFEEDDVTDEQLEGMTNKQLSQHITKQVERALAKSLKPILSRVETVSKETETDRVKRELIEVRSKYSDLPKWKDELKAVLAASPSMSIEDAYLLAKAKHPDKVKEIEAENAKTQEEADKADNSKKRFGGLTPTSDTGGAKEDEGKLGPKEAADKAWAEAMAGVPKELVGEFS